MASSEEEDDVLSVDLSDESARREIKKEEDTEQPRTSNVKDLVKFFEQRRSINEPSFTGQRNR